MISAVELGTRGLEFQANQLASHCQISGNSGEGLIDYYRLSKADAYDGIWETYQDKYILDLCAGTSDLVARYRMRGAKAFALDFGYSNKEAFLNKAIRLSDARRPFWLPRRFWGSSVSSTFLDSYRNNSEIYMAGSSHEIPFPPGTFDAVLSSFGIFGVVDKNFDLLEASVDASLEAIKPDGIIIYGPFMSKKPYLSDLERQNQERLVKELNRRGDLLVYPQYPNRGYRAIDEMGQLVIQKAA